MTFVIEKQSLTVKEAGTGRRWKACSYSEFDTDYSCYLNGSSAFDLEQDGDVWIVRNDAPHSSQYRTRKQYLRALARGEHTSPELSRATVAELPSLEDAFLWAIRVYKAKGWITRDTFSDSLTMTPMKKRLAA